MTTATRTVSAERTDSVALETTDEGSLRLSHEAAARFHPDNALVVRCRASSGGSRPREPLAGGAARHLLLALRAGGGRPADGGRSRTAAGRGGRFGQQSGYVLGVCWPRCRPRGTRLRCGGISDVPCRSGTGRSDL